MQANCRIFALALAVLVLQACAGMRPGYETPSVTVNAFRVLPSAGTLPNFEIGLEVVNPNREALKLKGIAYTVSLEGQEVIKGVGNDLPVIEPYGTGQVTVTAAANLFAGIRLFREMMASQKGHFDYEFEAKLDLGGFYPPIRVKESGSLASLNAAPE
ncbi:MAG TPA: LEA type 2 family protein [Woeseiaceae bacterium]|nr:LEA type 2 family protein [Woeseiaceae bacterium]